MKKFLIPVAIIVVGTGAAFSSNAAKNSPLVLQDGYRIDGTGQCIKTVQKCSDVPSTTCTWQGNVLHEKVSDNPTVCGNDLFMP